MPNTVESDNIPCVGTLTGKKIILGVTGSIAAYKAAGLASALVKRGADVHVVMTRSARELIGPPTFWSLTGNPVICEMFEAPAKPEITHVSLPASADLLLIAPATANIIGKLANGLADDMLSTMALVVRCPVIIAPAMNMNMYTNSIVVANMDRLKQHDYTFVDPESGRLACGNEGVGRLADPVLIIKAVEEALIGPRDYSGVKILVTAGPTQEPIDPVRFISNRSSGKMGYAIAEMAARRGAIVTLISGPTDLPAPANVDTVRVNTVHEMFVAVTERVEDARVFISAAAPADFIPANAKGQKIKKSARMSLEMDAAEDILAEVGKHKESMILVGFAAETEKLEEYAEEKLRKKNLDLIVANDVSLGSDTFGSDSNQVTLLSKTGERVQWPRMSKREVANGILEFIKKSLWEESF